MLAATPLVKGDSFNATLPGFWIAGALLAWAIHWRWQGGLVAAACLSVVDLAIRPELSQANYGNVFLIMIAGPLVGYLCDSLVTMAAERDRALRSAAVAAERTRLARAVHDGVLQVLVAGAAARPRAGWGVRRAGRDGRGAGVAAALADPSAGHRGRAGDRGGPRPRRRPRAARVPAGDGVDARGAGPRRRQPRCGDRGRRARLPGQRRRLTSAPRRRPGCCSRSSGPTSW